MMIMETDCRFFDLYIQGCLLLNGQVLMELNSGNALPSQQFTSTGATGEITAVTYLMEEYLAHKSLFDAQPVQVQRFLETQARALAEALLTPTSHAHFSLPDQLVVRAGDFTETVLPAGLRKHTLGGLMNRLKRTGLMPALRRRLDELETSTHPAVAASASLLRYATAAVLVRDMLPAGRSVRYQALAGEEIPSLPVNNVQARGSAIAAASDVIVEETRAGVGADRGELLVPYVPSAQRFFLPQWVAFDEQNHPLVRSTAEAESYLASMQAYISTLHAAATLAPYMLADEIYQYKRYGMLGQLVNQGRALARFEVSQVIDTIRLRAAAGNLNRGLSLSLDYFDDQHLAMKRRDFDVIPSGRIMFVPAFVVLAVRREQAKVEQDTRLNQATRSHLLVELRMLEDAFLSSDQKI